MWQFWGDFCRIFIIIGHNIKTHVLGGRLRSRFEAVTFGLQGNFSLFCWDSTVNRNCHVLDIHKKTPKNTLQKGDLNNSWYPKLEALFRKSTALNVGSLILPTYQLTVASFFGKYLEAFEYPNLLHSLKSTLAPENGPKPKRKRWYFNHFQVLLLLVSGRVLFWNHPNLDDSPTPFFIRHFYEVSTPQMAGSHRWKTGELPLPGVPAVRSKLP